MTEKEFEQRIEDAADRLEKKIESSADKLDKSITARWEKSQGFRIGVKAVSVSIEIALIIGAWQLAGHGHKTAAKWCLILALLAIMANLITYFAFRQK